MPTSAYPLAVVSGPDAPSFRAVFPRDLRLQRGGHSGTLTGATSGPGPGPPQNAPIADLIADGESDVKGGAKVYLEADSTSMNRPRRPQAMVKASQSVTVASYTGEGKIPSPLMG